MRISLVALVLTVTGFGLTSCDSDTISTIINVVSQLIGGKTTTFSGYATSSMLTRADSDSQWNWVDTDSAQSSKTQTSMTCQVSMSTETDSLNNSYQVVNLIIPSLTYGNYTFTNLTLYGGNFITSDNATGTFSTENMGYYYNADSYSNGSTTVGLSSTEGYYAVIFDGQITSDAIKFSYSIVANNEAFNGTYVGSLVQ